MGAPRIGVGLALVDDEGDQPWVFRAHGRDRF
jgi:hypothetical protein